MSVGTEQICESGIYRIQIGENFYFGSAISLKNRKWQHHGQLKRGIHTNPRMQRAYNKHQEFHCETVEFVTEKSNLIIREQEYISAHYSDKRCMNLSPTAGSCYGVKHTEEARANMSKAHIGLQAGSKHPLYGKKRPPEVSAKISLVTKGRKYSSERLANHRLAMKSDDRSAKIRKAQTGRKQSAETVEKRVIHIRGAKNHKARGCLINHPIHGEISFDTVTDAANRIGTRSQTLVRWLNGSRPWPSKDSTHYSVRNDLKGLTGEYLS